MTKEQEEAIEILKRIDIRFFLSGMNEQSNYIVDEADKVNKAIETVLNLIQEQQKDIEKKEKMIDEIIGFLATRTWATCPNEDCGANLDCENRCSNDDNIDEECWKMYFENQAKM